MKTALENLKKIDSENNYEFVFNEKKIIKFIKSRMRNSLKFSMYTILEKNNMINKNGEIFLREFRYFYNYENNKSKTILY